MDFFTLTFGILYCFFVIAHDRRRILHCDVTRNPNALWANEVGLLSAADHDRLTADYERHPREAAGALAKGTVIRDLLLSIFAGFANGRSVSSQRLSELNSALAQAPGLLRVMKKSDRIETEWMSTAQGLSQVFLQSLRAQQNCSLVIAWDEFASAPLPIAHGSSSTRAVTAADAGAT